MLLFMANKNTKAKRIHKPKHGWCKGCQQTKCLHPEKAICVDCIKAAKEVEAKS